MQLIQKQVSERSSSDSASKDASENSALLERLKNGDLEALDAVYDRHKLMLYRDAFAILKNADDALECNHCTFIVLHGRNGQIKTSLAGWLKSVNKNIALGLLRSRRENRAKERNYQLPRSADPLMKDSLLQAILDEAVERLPERESIVINLVYYEGMTHEEAAARTGLPKGTVSTLVLRALNRLRLAFRNEGMFVNRTAIAALLVAFGPDSTPRLGFLAQTMNLVIEIAPVAELDMFLIASIDMQVRC